MSIRTNVIEQLRENGSSVSYNTSWGSLIGRAFGSRLGDMTVWGLRAVAVAAVFKLFGIA